MAIPSATPGIGAGLVWLRQDWLDALNLEGPKTLEDLEHVLEEFVTKIRAETEKERPLVWQHQKRLYLVTMEH